MFDLIGDFFIILEQMEYECAICLEKYKIGDLAKELECEHYFHESCIMRWAETVSFFFK